MRALSASAIKLWRSCPRRFTFRYIEGLEQESTEATSLGAEIHAEMEAWVKSSVLPKHPLAIKLLAAFAGTDFVPMRGKTEAESEFTLTIADIPWRGFVDARQVVGDTVYTIDYKSCKDINRYALRSHDPETKEPYGLLKSSEGEVDVQSTLYAAKEFVQGAKRVIGVWAYVGTGKNPQPATRLVVVEFDRDKVEGVYATLHADALDVQQLYAIRPKANDVPYRSSSCLSWNRPCEYTALCNKPSGLFTAQSLNLDQKENAMKDFVAELKKSFPGAAQTIEEEDAPPLLDEDVPPLVEDDEPPPLADAEEIEAERLAQEYMASTRKPAPAPTAVEAGFVNAPEAAGKKPYATPEEAAIGEGVVFEPAPEGKTVDELLAEPGVIAVLDEPLTVGATTGQEHVVVGDLDVPEVVETPAPKKRGRPKKVKLTQENAMDVLLSKLGPDEETIDTTAEEVAPRNALDLSKEEMAAQHKENIIKEGMELLDAQEDENSLTSGVALQRTQPGKSKHIVKTELFDDGLVKVVTTESYVDGKLMYRCVDTEDRRTANVVIETSENEHF